MPQEKPICKRYLIAPGIETIYEGGGTSLVKQTPLVPQTERSNVPITQFYYSPREQLITPAIVLKETTAATFNLDESEPQSTSYHLTEWVNNKKETIHYHLELFPLPDKNNLVKIMGNLWKRGNAHILSVLANYRPRVVLDHTRLRLLFNILFEGEQGITLETADLMQITSDGSIIFNPQIIPYQNTHGSWARENIVFRTDLDSKPKFVEVKLISIAGQRVKIILGCTFDNEAYAKLLAGKQLPIKDESGKLDEKFYRGIVNPYLLLSST